MREFVLDRCMNNIIKNEKYDEIKLAEIKYGLETLYLMFSKLIIISIIAMVLGIFKELVIFLLIYNIIRMPSFGLHATKSWICLLSSTVVFIGVPLLIRYTIIENTIKIIVGVIMILHMFAFSPADTKKRPIVNKKRRKIYKILSTIICFLYIVLSIIIEESFIANCFLFATILQNIMISPLTYSIFKLPYNNYKVYIKTHGLNE